MKNLLTLLLLAVGLLCQATMAQNTVVAVETPAGSFNIELFEDSAPRTAANFLNYLRDGDYEDAFIHRSVNGFVIQGGGFRFVSDQVVDVPTDAPISNEFGASNLRGTVAMARAAGDADSATSQWFVNVGDNTNLDTVDGGFTVFGRVLGDGMQVVDVINSLRMVNAGAAFNELPVINFSGGAIALEQLVTTRIREVTFAANRGLSGAWFNPNTSGQGWLFDVFDAQGTATIFAAWFTYDVNDPATDETAGFASNQHRWLTASGTFTGNTANLTMQLNSGGVFNQADQDTPQEIGTMTIDFSDCMNAQLSWNFDDALLPDAAVNITRLSPDTFCERIVDGRIAID